MQMQPLTNPSRRLGSQILKEDPVFFRLPTKTAIKPILIERSQMTPRFNLDTPIKDTKTTNATNPDTDRSKEFDSKVKELSDMFQNFKFSPETKRVIQDSLTSSVINDPKVFCKKKSKNPPSTRGNSSTILKSSDNSKTIPKLKAEQLLKGGLLLTPTKKPNGVILQPKLMKKLLSKPSPRKPIQSSVILRPKTSARQIQRPSSEKRLNSAASTSKLSLSKQSSTKSLQKPIDQQDPKLVLPSTPSTLYTLSRQSIQQKLIDRFRKPANPKTVPSKEVLKPQPKPKDLKKKDDDDEDAFIERVYNRLMKLNFQLSHQYKAS
jgi:hypothetical protein